MDTPSGVGGQFSFRQSTINSLMAEPKRLPVWTVAFVYWIFVCGDAEGSEAELVALVAAMVEVLVWGSEMLVALVEAVDEVLFWGSERPLLIGAGSYAQAPSRF